MNNQERGEEQAMQTIKRISLVDSVVEHILQSIQNKRFLPGDKIPPERELTVALGVSRTALREAIKRLESLGVLTVRQGDGTYVRADAGNKEQAFRQGMRDLFSMGDIHMRDFLEARELIESKAVVLAAERATDEELRRLEHLQECMEKSVDDRERFLRYDIDFHRFLMELSRNPILLRFSWSIDDLLNEQIKRSVTTHENLQSALEAHSEIVDAVCSRNPARAEQALRSHLKKISTLLLNAVLNRTKSEDERKDSPLPWRTASMPSNQPF